MSTTLVGARTMLKIAKYKASEIWTASAGLYREMASSALRLVPSRR